MRQHILFKPEEDQFIIDSLSSSFTVYDLTDKFNAAFPNHPSTRSNIQHRMKKLGLHIGTHNVRHPHSRNSIGTVICNSEGKKARVKTANGYVDANQYFEKLYRSSEADNRVLIHLNGDYSDFCRDHIEMVDPRVKKGMMFRKWIFPDIELTRTAMLAQELILLLPYVSKNENQFLRISR